MTDLQNPLKVDESDIPVIRPPATTFRKSGTAIEREATEKSSRDETLALDIARVVAGMHTDAVLDQDEFTEYCERVWQWVTTDTWPPAGSLGSSSED